MATYSLKAESWKWMITPTAFMVYAREYFRIAVLAVPQEQAYSPVPYFLFCRSIEIGLKSFLLAHGVKLIDLKSRKKFGHDLIKCLDAACTYNLQHFWRLSETQLEHLQQANECYSEKGFEYIHPFRLLVPYLIPSISELENIAAKITQLPVE